MARVHLADRSPLITTHVMVTTRKMTVVLLLAVGEAAAAAAQPPPPSRSSGPVDAWTARWHGAVGEPFETPWSTRQLWKQQGCPLGCHVDWNDGSQMMPRGPLLGQGDLGMTVISEQLPPCSPAPCAPTPHAHPDAPGTGNISLHLGANQLWAISDNDWTQCHYDVATCNANGQYVDLLNESADGSTNGCWPGWLPGCRHSFPRRVGFGGLNISSAAFAGPQSRFVAEQRMRDGTVMAGYARSDGATLTATSLMDDSVKAMLTDLHYNGSGGSITVKLALWTYDMAVNASFVNHDNFPSTAAAIASSATAALSSSASGESLPYVTRKTLPDSWNASAQLYATASTKVLRSSSSAAAVSWSVEGDSAVASLTLQPGETVTLITAMHTSRDAAALATGHAFPPPPWRQHDPLPLTLAYVRGLNAASASKIREDSAAWWRRFWAKSAVEIPSEPLLQYFWNAAQYVLGSASRPGKVVPSLFGPWVISDDPAWYGDMTMDYNQQAAFYQVASSNHPEQAQPEFDAMAAFLPEARDGAARLLEAYNRTCGGGSTGLTFSSHMSPYGFAGAIGTSPIGDLRMRWEGIWSVSTHISDWEYTRNVTTLRRRTWPLATGLAEMWRCWLVKTPAASAPGGYLLVDEDDSWGEQNLGQTPNLINPNQPIAWLTRLFTFLPVMATALGQPVPAWWGEVLVHLPPQPILSVPSQDGGGQLFGMASNIMVIDDTLTAVHPAEVADILGEIPNRAQLIAANTTLMKQGPAVRPNPEQPRYNAPYIDYTATRGTHVWTAAARIAAAHPSPHMASCVLRSWQPNITGDLLECLNVWLNFTMMPSAVTTFRTQPFWAQGGTLESASVAQTVNDILLTSHGHGLRLFPIWAALRPTVSASFTTLRAKGAFLVSAAYDGAARRVGNFTVLSEAGQMCRVLLPWPRNATIVIGKHAANAQAASGRGLFRVVVGAYGWFEFATEAGATYTVSAADW